MLKSCLLLNLGIRECLGEPSHQNIYGLITVFRRDGQDDLSKFTILESPMTTKTQPGAPEAQKSTLTPII